MSRFKPVYGLGLFFVRETGLIEQSIVFEYHDPDEEYKEIVLDENRWREEKKLLSSNMQYFLDEEIVEINNKRVYPRVVDVEIGFKGDYKNPYIFFIIQFIGEFYKGINIYEDSYKPEITEYDYRVYWFFPLRARVLKADLGVPYTLLDKGRILSFHVSTGTRIRGYEKIEFEIL